MHFSDVSAVDMRINLRCRNVGMSLLGFLYHVGWHLPAEDELQMNVAGYEDSLPYRVLLSLLPV